MPIVTSSIPVLRALGNSRNGGLAAEELGALGEATGECLLALLRLSGESSEGEPSKDGDPGALPGMVAAKGTSGGSLYLRRPLIFL